MSTRKIVIVGGVAGGATAATRLRRLDETASIILFERGPYVSFANCGLPYYIGEVIPERGDLLVQTAQGLSKRFQLDVRTLSEVISIERSEQKIVVKDLSSGETYEETYDILILSPGAQPVVPPIPGLKEAKHVFSLRSLADMDRIKDELDRGHPQNVLVIGGGFIGLEMAENLQLRGTQVIVVEMLDQVMAPLDYEMAALVHQHLRKHGVRLILGDGVKAFEDQGQRVMLQSGASLAADMIILAIGVRPENALAVKAGLEIGERGGILANERLQTSDEHIYAIGDAIEVKDYITHLPNQVPLAWPANRQGRLVADVIAGKKATYKGTLGTAVVKVFDLTVATTGLNEKTLRRLGWKYQVVHTHPSSHATYYPGSSTFALKLLFQPETGSIYGAQGVGKEGVDKRIDVLATAIKGGLTVFDLPDLELAYAPPYSSAKDPVNMLGYVASNLAEGAVKTIQFDEIDQVVAAGGLLIDVRDPEEFKHGAIPGSVNIPLNELRSHIGELPTDQPIYLTCRVGQRGYIASRILEQHGYNAINLDGGYLTYKSVHKDKKALDFQVEKQSANLVHALNK
ncbi:MAG TPA: CoA-disulfide reductase [Ktedonobacteraceae bacterium]|nr:CoA-disulfide reductase [Ktedonobacteraceae bacterium]